MLGHAVLLLWKLLLLLGRADVQLLRRQRRPLPLLRALLLQRRDRLPCLLRRLLSGLLHLLRRRLPSRVHRNRCPWRVCRPHTRRRMRRRRRAELRPWSTYSLQPLHRHSEHQATYTVFQLL